MTDDTDPRRHGAAAGSDGESTAAAPGAAPDDAAHEPGTATGGPTDAGNPTRADDQVGVDTGRHAVQRPVPVPPPGGISDGPDHADAPAGQPAASTPTGDGTGPAAAPAAPPADPAPAPTGTAPASPPAEGATAPRPAARDDLFPDTHAPRTPHAGTHVLGTLLGLVLAPVTVVLLLLGQSRVLAVQVDGWDASLELLGIVLVTAGGLVAASLVLLGLWTAAAPVTAGIVVAALGGLQLYAPGIARTATLDLVGSASWSHTLKQATVAGTSGTTFTVGLLLLASGVVVALARRHGIRLGAFRERHRHVAPAGTPVRGDDQRD